MVKLTGPVKELKWGCEHIQYSSKHVLKLGVKNWRPQKTTDSNHVGQLGPPVASQERPRIHDRTAQPPWRTHGLDRSNKKGRNRIRYELDDPQIDANGFAAFRSHNLAFLPLFSSNFPPNELVFIDRFGRGATME